LATVLLLSGIPTDLVEDDAVVLSFNDRQAVGTPLPRTLLMIGTQSRKESEMNGKRRRKLGSVIGVAALLAALAVPTSLPASAVEVPDQVLAWNQHAYDELIVTKLQPPPVSVLNLALVHGAIYDAVNAIDGGYESYLGAPAASPSYSEDAAAAASAYRVLLYLVPDRELQLTGYYNDSLGLIPDGAAENGGVAVGEAAAAAMILERTGDGRNGTTLFTEGTLKGEWRRVPLVTGGNSFRWVGQVDPFLIPSAAQFATFGPKKLASDAYAREFARVKRLGRATGSTRTADQTSQALFWADHAVAMWTRTSDRSPWPGTSRPPTTPDSSRCSTSRAPTR
jgi:hypothetical protein